MSVVVDVNIRKDGKIKVMWMMTKLDDGIVEMVEAVYHSHEISLTVTRV
jgi:hypothetical protein